MAREIDSWSYLKGRDDGEKEMINIINSENEPKVCKICGSRNVVRYGHSKHRQRLLCRECKHTFMDSDTLPGMKVSPAVTASAVNRFYEGSSLNQVRRGLQQDYGVYPSDSTVYEWIRRYTKTLVAKADTYHPQVGDVFVADETVLKIEGRNYWFWDLIDAKTRVLLSSRISATRTTRDARALVEEAAKRAGKTPKVIVTDKLAAYLDGIELAFGADTKHIPAKTLTSEPAKELIERFHGTLKQRTKVMRGLKSRKSAELFLNGWLAFYNYLRPHEGLGNKTPGEKAEVKFAYSNWLAVVNDTKLSHSEVNWAKTEAPISEPAKSLSASATLGHFADRKVKVNPSQIATPKRIIIESRQSVTDRVGKVKTPNTSLSKPRRVRERQSDLASDIVIGKGGRRHIRLY